MLAELLLILALVLFLTRERPPPPPNRLEQIEEDLKQWTRDREPRP